MWPHERTLKEELEATQPKLLPKQILWRPRPQPEHQKDAERRDRKMNEEDQRTARYRPPRNEDMDRRSNMWKMERALSGQNNSGTTPDRSHQHLIRSARRTTIDIAIIGSAPFERHMKQKNSEIFITSLYEIDRIIKEKRLEEQQAEEAKEQELIQQRLPAQYKEYSDVFSKAASDELPPHRSNDYQIKIEEGASPEQTVGHSPLYKQS